MKSGERNLALQGKVAEFRAKVSGIEAGIRDVGNW